MSRTVKLSIGEGILWTLLMAVIALWSVDNIHKHTLELSLYESRAFFEEIVTTRDWNAFHGGVYVPVSEKTQPNPYLIDKDRDIVTTGGMVLTKINPAYMTRQISEIAAEKNSIMFHITSDRPIRPENAADSWELNAMEEFKRGKPEYYNTEILQEGYKYFRYMAPLWVKTECLSCHERHGYKTGELRGGISIKINAAPILRSHKIQEDKTLISFILIWLIGLCGILLATYYLLRAEKKKESLILKLESSLDEVKKLSGMLPICSSCKKVRDDTGYWNQIENYISSHSDAQFSHSICPHCAEKLYGNEDWYNKKK